MADKIPRRTFLLSSLATLATVLSGCATSRNPLRQVSTRLSADLGDNVEMLYIRAVQNGEHKSFVYRGSDLQNRQIIDINGYITGIISFNKKGVVSKLNSRLMDPLRKFEDSVNIASFCIYPDHLATDTHDSKFFAGLIENLRHKRKDECAVKDAYGVGKFNGWYPIGEREVHELHFSGKRVRIKNIAFEKILSKDGKQFYYLGNSYERLRRAAESRVPEICNGIANVEKYYGVSLVDRVNFIDYNIDNASADQNKGVINIFTKSLGKKELENIIEHETLHRFVFEAGYTEDRELRELFFDLKGTKNKFNVITGFQPFADYITDYHNKDFFEFISEGNYFVAEGGHPHANIWEFCTSFFHTLMYFDRFEENLSKLPEDKQSNVIDCYTRTLTTMIGKNKRYDILLRERLDYMAHLNYQKS